MIRGAIVFEIGGELKDEQQAPDASRTGARGWKGRMSMRSESLRRGGAMMDDWNARGQ